MGDKEDTALYRLDPTAAASTITALEVPLVLRPAAWDLLQGCTGAKKGRLDLEGITFNPKTATPYLINDNNAAWNRITAGDPEKEPTLLYLLEFKGTP